MDLCTAGGACPCAQVRAPPHSPSPCLALVQRAGGEGAVVTPQSCLLRPAVGGTQGLEPGWGSPEVPVSAGPYGHCQKRPQAQA